MTNRRKRIILTLTMGSGGKQKAPKPVVYKLPKMPKLELPEPPAPAKPPPPPSPPATRTAQDVQDAARMEWIRRVKRSGYEKTLVVPPATTGATPLG